MNRQAARLRARAGLGDGSVGGSMGEVEQAKQRLRLEGEGLQASLELLALPLVRESRAHPWRLLALGTAGGAAVGWMDGLSNGRLHRLALRALGPWLRTLTARAGLRGP